MDAKEIINNVYHIALPKRHLNKFIIKYNPSFAAFSHMQNAESGL